MGISVDDLSGENRAIPNPVRTFHEAFEHYRKPDVFDVFIL